MSIVTVVGNPRSGSRTLTVATKAAETLANRLGVEAGDVVDLSGLAPALFSPEPSPGVEVALELLLDASILVVASPTYKGTYTGLLKSFLDKLPSQALAGKVALPLLVLGDPKHSLAVEVHFRPLLVELGAAVPTPGLVVLESRIPDLDELLAAWADTVIPQLTRHTEVLT
ncbi:NAD(P)H-dependent oxidoreductase [Acrocarpospora macrocephala]|uniref:FMN reductase n=1 Tax=Acrocarpospora macrocephala TaxID=150177 RepID=A0A5M3WX59_9ACTN|nr:NAD(P)H-dependent oxidoreductase [Acrocarpospora macrocephala]GES13340.1 FMN reductase [Acrocarpospora macrocephala]